VFGKSSEKFYQGELQKSKNLDRGIKGQREVKPGQEDAGRPTEILEAQSSEDKDELIKILKFNLEFLSKKNLASYNEESSKWHKNFDLLKARARDLTNKLRECKKSFALRKIWEDFEAAFRALECNGGFNKDKDYKFNSIFQFKTYYGYLDVIAHLIQYSEKIYHHYEDIDEYRKISSKFDNRSLTIKQASIENPSKTTKASCKEETGNAKCNHKEIFGEDPKIFDSIDYHKENILNSITVGRKSINPRRGIQTSAGDLAPNFEEILQKNQNTPDQTYNLLLLDLKKSKTEIASLRERLDLSESEKIYQGKAELISEGQHKSYKEKISKLERKLDEKELFFTKSNFLVGEINRKMEDLERKNEILEEKLIGASKTVRFYEEINAEAQDKFIRLREISLMGMEDYNVLFDKYKTLKAQQTEFKNKFMMTFGFSESHSKKLSGPTPTAKKFDKVPLAKQNPTDIIKSMTDLFTTGHHYYKFSTLNENPGLTLRNTKSMSDFFAFYCQLSFPSPNPPSSPDTPTPTPPHLHENLLISRENLSTKDLSIFSSLKTLKPHFTF
jgi:hypothetical protein